MKKEKLVPKNHREYYGFTEGLRDDVLIDWYEKCQPVGSGPLGMMRMLCAAIEEIAEQRGLQLPEPQGLRK